MPLDLSRTLVVGISSTALFDLNEADRLFRELRKDDQDVHVESAAKRVPTGKVLYRSNSKLRNLQEERAQRNGGK